MGVPAANSIPRPLPGIVQVISSQGFAQEPRLLHTNRVQCSLPEGSISATISAAPAPARASSAARSTSSPCPPLTFPESIKWIGAPGKAEAPARAALIVPRGAA